MQIKNRHLMALMLAGCVDIAHEDDFSETEQALGPVVTLRALWNPTTGDNALTSNSSWAPAGYTYYRTEGRIFSPSAPRPPETLPLWTWYGASRGDYMTTTNPYWDPAGGTSRNNYTYVRLEGYVHERPVGGTWPLQMWWSPSRGDNHTSSDPRFTHDITQISSPDYDYARAEGYVYPATTEQSPESRTNFRWGDTGGVPSGPRGLRDLLVLRMSYSDFSSVFTTAQIDDLLWGPSFPNMEDYINEVSQNRFNWRRTSTLGEYVYPDDPQTSGDESSYDESIPGGASTRMAFVTLKGASGDRIGASALDRVVPGGPGEQYETFQLHDVNGGDLFSGDLVALKTIDGRWVRESSGVVTADGTNASGSSLFTINSGGPDEITTETNITLQSSAGRYLYEDVAGGRIRASTSITLDSLFFVEKSFPDVERQTRSMISRAVAAGYNFRVHDKDSDGVIESDECTVMVLGATPSNRGGANRHVRELSIPGTSPALRLGAHGGISVADRASFMTIIHELLHQFISYEMYGAGNFRLSAMSATIIGGVDNRETWLLDPHTRMRLGWVEPEIHAYKSTGGSGVQYTPDSTGVRPLLIYHPDDYDTGADSGEFFMLEFRNNERAGYDQDTSGRGVALWRVTTNRANTIGADGSTGGSQLWTAANGTFTPTYSDGSASPFRIRVGASTSASSAIGVEWTGNGQLRPRLDGGTVVIRPGQIASLDGVFSVDATTAGVRWFNVDTGVSTPGSITPPSTTTPWSTSRVYVTVPSTLEAGNYRVYVWKNVSSRESNGHPIEILPPL